MNNYEKIINSKNVGEMAEILAYSDLGETIAVEQPITDESFYREWLLQEVEE